MKLGLALSEAGSLDAAVVELTESVSLRPTALAYHHLGNAFIRLGNIAKAIEAFGAAVELDNQFVPSANNLAWLLATTTDDSLRDGPRAVTIAEAICSNPSNQTAGNFDTLAAAYAEAGRFDDAVRTINQAIRIAKAAGDLARTGRMQKRLALYQQNQPYRDTP